MTGPISRELRCREIPLLIVIARSEARPNAEREILARWFIERGTVFARLLPSVSG